METMIVYGAVSIGVVALALSPLGMIISAFVLAAAAATLAGISKGAIHEVGACVLLVGAVLCAACAGLARQLESLRQALTRGETPQPSPSHVQVSSNHAPAQVGPLKLARTKTMIPTA